MMPGRQVVTVTVILAGLVWLGASDGAGIYDYSSKLSRKNTTILLEVLKDRLGQQAVGGFSYLDLAKLLIQQLPTNISDTCRQQSLSMLQSLRSLASLQVLDSIGKPSAGFLEGNLYWMGDFDECVNANSGSDASVAFVGQYCKLSLPLSLAGQLGQSVTLQVGICVPSGCSRDDVQALFNRVLLLMRRSNYTQLAVDCHSPRSLDSKANVAIVVLSVLSALVIIGTLCDVVQSVRSSTRGSTQASFTGHDAPLCIESNPVESRYQEQTPLLWKHHDSQHVHTDAGPAGLFWQIITTFSCYKNGRKLLSTNQAQGSLACINGIRFLSISWVVLGHTYYFNGIYGVVGDPALFYTQTVFSRSFQVIFNSSVSVDTFFLLSGFLATYLFLGEINKKHGRLSVKDWALVYLHRYIRLTPAYAVILMVWTCLGVYMSDGPTWPTGGSFDACYNYWWTNLLYVNNLVRPDTSACMDWTWYLANDMQFFVITPVLVFLLSRCRRIGIAATLVVTCGSVASAAAISTVHSYKMGFLGGVDGSWFTDMYIKPWCRFEAYGIGILLGYIIYTHAGGLIMNALTVIAGWLLAAGCCLSVLYAPYEAQFGTRAATAPLAENVSYNALSRLAWSVGVAWVIFACSTGYAGWVNRLLSWRAFTPLARLTYCTYLIHPIVMTLYAASARGSVHLGVVFAVPLYLGMLVISLALAFVASLAFEAPILGIEKLLREKSKRSIPLN